MLKGKNVPTMLVESAINFNRVLGTLQYVWADVYFFLTRELNVVTFIDDATTKVHVYRFKRKDGIFPKLSSCG